MSDEFTATVREIANGYIVTYSDKEYFTPQFDIASFLKSLAGVDHEKVLQTMVMAAGADRKISTIKSVRDYCITNNYDKYQGLRDAKEYVEGLRDWYCGVLRSPIAERLIF